jgi:hypothetical protein
VRRIVTAIRYRAILLFVLCICANGAHATECVNFSAAVAAFVDAQVQLLALTPSDDLDPMLTPPVQQGIARAKAAIAAIVRARLACAGADETSEQLENDLNQAMRTVHAGCGERCAHSAYGDVPEFAVAPAAVQPQLIGIVARMPIECGLDSALFVFEREAGAWRERLHWQSAPYTDVSGAFEAFDYKISPPDAHGRWYVLVKDVAPWCSSTWSTVRYAVLRPSSSGATPIVFRGEDEIYWGSEDFGAITANARDFDVRFHAASIDPGVHNRVWIRHFTIDGDTVRRVPPIALTPRDFVDEWIRTPWAQAARWSAPAKRAALARSHRQLRAAWHKHYYEFAAIHACPGRPHRYEVGLTSDDDEPDWFLTIRGDSDFTLIGVARAANPACRGPDLRDTMQTQ